MLFSDLPITLTAFREAGIRLSIDDPIYDSLHNRIREQLWHCENSMAFGLGEDTGEQLSDRIEKFSREMQQMGVLDNFALVCRGEHGIHQIAYAYRPVCCDVYRTAGTADLRPRKNSNEKGA